MLIMPRSFTITSPAVAAEIAYTSVSPVYDEIIAVILTLTTDANVASRRVSLEFTDGTRVIGIAVCAGLLVAGTTNRICFAPGAPNTQFANTPTQTISPMPANLWIPFNGTINSISQLLQVGDQYSAISVYTNRRFMAL